MYHLLRCGLCTVAAMACAGVLSAETSYGRARVISVEPIVQKVYVSSPVEYYDEYETSSRGSATSSIVGGLVGGVVGNQFGKGDGKVATTVAGALLGASLGSDMGRGRPHTVAVRRQRVERRAEERIEGYRVAYEYGGKRYFTQTTTPPGSYIDVRVETTVYPIVDGYTR